MKTLLYFSLLTLSFNAFAYVNCTNVAVGAVQSSTSTSFHGMHHGGAMGSMIFVGIDVTKCTAVNNEDLSNGAYLVIDDYAAGDNLKTYLASMLLTAKASNSTISFHAYSGGGNNSGAAVLEPYYLKID